LVRLEWVTASETNNRGFHVERSTNGEDFSRIGWKEAAGEGATGAQYSYLDSPVNNGVTYTYRLVDEDINGNETINAMIAEATPSFLGDAVEITEYRLYQNYPNPFNPATRIVYDVLEAGHVLLKVYNVMGQKIATLVDEDQSSSRHSIIFDATRSSSGIYFYVIDVNDFTDVKKMLYIQ
jgi:hypothetical protein